MKKLIYIISFAISLVILTSCGAYSFTGGNTGDAKTIQINFFRNEASLIEPTLSQRFTQDLQDLFTRQTNLTLVKTGGDLYFEGEITGYRIIPVTATANQTAAENRLTITVNVRFTNKLNEEDNFEKQFSYGENFNANQLPQGAVLENLLDIIIPEIQQRIFNESVAKW